MDIGINGKTADITIESEETIGELLAGIETWLAGAGFRLSGLEVDGESVDIGAIPAVCGRNLQGIRRIDVKASSKPELLLEALCYAREYLKAYTEASREDGRRIAEDWNLSAAARFLSAESPPVSRDLAGFFSGEGAEFQRLYALIEERIRELTDPRGELAGMEKQVADIVLRLEDLPLDIQTGKDGRAAETITLFSDITEKLFRLFYQIGTGQIRSGAPCGGADSPPPGDLSEDFNLALKELLAAYETKDVVLIGDLAEYEIAPRLQTLYSSMNVPEAAPSLT
ncbi:MAG: hypothetical protein LBP43_03355 [Treponema sp.]|jgi:hypothetical protein|nr:hypothetical protein [Treponema sp.]